MAQDDLDPDTVELKESNSGCTDLSVLSRLPSSLIVSCEKRDSAEVTLPLAPDAQGYGREKSVHGPYEFREYQIHDADQQEQAFDTLTRFLGIAGFIVKYSSSPSTITGRNQGIWSSSNQRGVL